MTCIMLEVTYAQVSRMKATLFAVGCMPFLCKVKTQLATLLRPKLDGQPQLGRVDLLPVLSGK